MNKYYIKDKVDGPEHCLSGDKQFYLIPADEIIIADLLDDLDKVEKVIRKTPTGYQDHKDFIEEGLKEILFS